MSRKPLTICIAVGLMTLACDDDSPATSIDAAPEADARPPDGGEPTVDADRDRTIGQGGDPDTDARVLVDAGARDATRGDALSPDGGPDSMPDIISPDAMTDVDAEVDALGPDAAPDGMPPDLTPDAMPDAARPDADPPPPALMPSWVETTRLAQVSGAADPEGLFHAWDTREVGIGGIDLGASTVWRDRTYIFFGDVPRTDGRVDGPAYDADAIGVLEDIRVPAPAHVAAAPQTADQVDAFFVGEDGALYVAWATGPRPWQQPLRISAPGFAPPGAFVATTAAADGALRVFVSANDGAVYVSTVRALGAWEGPERIGPPGRAQPGGVVATAYQTAEQLVLFFIGRDGRLNIVWSLADGPWQGPVPIGAPGAPYPAPGSGVTASRRGDLLEALFVGADGAPYVAWVEGVGGWQGPARIGDAGMGIAGSPIAAFPQSPAQTTALFVDAGGRLRVTWARDGRPWEAPVALGGAPRAVPGAPLRLASTGPDGWDVWVPSRDGALDHYEVVGAGAWQGPVEIAPPGSTSPTATPAYVRQGAAQSSVLYGGLDGTLSVTWSVDHGPWQGPAPINPPMLGTRFVTDGRHFRPLTIRGTENDPAEVLDLATDATPTGAFAFEDHVYTFVISERCRADCDPVACEGGCRDIISYLASSPTPERPGPFDLRFVFSRFSGPGRFLHVAPVVVDSAEIEGIEPSTPQGVILFGFGGLHPQTLRDDCLAVDFPGRFFLAYMPLVPGRGPALEDVRYYAGGDPPRWAASEGEAAALFGACYYWSAVSAGRVRPGGEWTLLYQLSAPRTVGDDPPDGSPREVHRQPIVARFAVTPWALADAVEVPLFDPDREGAWGRYMFGPGAPPSAATAPNEIRHPAFAYGAFLLHRYTGWDPARARVTLHYLMSTGTPYQVQLMRTIVDL